MKPCGCNFCNDLRNIEPAKYIGLPDNAPEEMKDFFKKAKDEKKFIWDTPDKFYIVDECPVCGYKFTEADYDSYY